HAVPAEAACDSPCASCPHQALGGEWWDRVDRARGELLEIWPPQEIVDRLREQGVPTRETIDRRDESAVAAIGELLSSGESVLAVCADVSRRRGLAEQAAGPRRFGGGRAVLAS